MPVNKKMAWIDLETTGLNSYLDVPLEIAAVITDVEGEELAHFQSLIMPPEWAVKLNAAPTLVQEMHSVSGLRKELTDAWTHSMEFEYREVFRPASVAARVIRFLQTNDVQTGLPVAGSTVGFDRAFMSAHMPKLNEYFGHRVIDISSLKELCRLLNPKVAYAHYEMTVNQPRAHRALPDIRASIAEYKFYRDNFLFTAGDDDYDDSNS